MLPNFGLKASQTQQSWRRPSSTTEVRRSRCWPPTSQGHTCRVGSYKKVPAETGWEVDTTWWKAKPMYSSRTCFNWVSKMFIPQLAWSMGWVPKVDALKSIGSYWYLAFARNYMNPTLLWQGTKQLPTCRKYSTSYHVSSRMSGFPQSTRGHEKNVMGELHIFTPSRPTDEYTSKS